MLKCDLSKDGQSKEVCGECPHLSDDYFEWKALTFASLACFFILVGYELEAAYSSKHSWIFSDAAIRAEIEKSAGQ